ncbi:YbjN domain-containing protein [Schaalia sp. 19OD2882]|uniref:YbjN domain-containing protein n=1 Tax=Schaalia sp. 19OD2882 TaxID=2794089 RepID=UPI001C1EC57C|nr:YbjN domain-containing protein [Schaalia sp. 19OD2882]QWW18868.1 YbjN domain-containing protein [Schaalia sp. 19OD2882]
MGLFASRPPASGVPIVTQDRIKAVFDEQKWHYYVDSDGDLGGMWDDDNFHFMLRGEDKEILIISGRWHGSLPMDRLEQVREFITNWHRGKLWPKCYHRIDDEGRIRLYTEVSIDYEHGATDKQIYQHVSCALGTSQQFFKALATELGN